MIVDYPWSKPGGAALQAAGVQGVMRYLSHDASKTLQRPEADDLAHHGIPMGVVFEDMANRAGDGYSAGMNDAVVAGYMATGQRNGYTDLAMPTDRPIYFACDFDAHWVDVAPYYAGAAHVIGQDRVGIYGGLDVITGAANAGYRWLWQTVAWSHGIWHPKATMRQELGEVTINGVQCDVNDHQVSDWGQWIPGGEAEVITDQDMEKLATLAAQKVWDTIIANDAGAINAETHLGRANVYALNSWNETKQLAAKLDEVIALLNTPKP